MNAIDTELYQAAQEAVDGNDAEGYAGFLHKCVDGSHQWCPEWDGDVHSTRSAAVAETYQALLNDYTAELAYSIQMSALFPEGD